MTYALVGDVGGTNARLALCTVATGEITQAKTYSGLEFDSLEAVIRQYLKACDIEVQDACIAIACPVTEDWVAMTNHSWAFSIKEMKASLGLSHLEVINDFTAVSMAIPMLSSDDVLQFGGGDAQPGKPIAVYGAGTGLGVAHLVHVDRRWVSLPGEGGHVDFAPNSEEEDIILEVLRAEVGHVSAERVLSAGPGQSVSRHRQGGQPPAGEMGAEGHHRAGAGRQLHRLPPRAVAVLRDHGALRWQPGAESGHLRRRVHRRRHRAALYGILQGLGLPRRFRRQGRFRDYVREIPVFMITHGQPGLLGAGAHLRQTLGMHL